MNRHLPGLRLFICVSVFILSFYNSVKAQGTSRVDIGKSYANLSKLSAGGTFNAGDTIEIRVTIAIITQSGLPTSVDKVQVFDTVPAKTTYVPGSMRIATNEGVTYKSFTDAGGDDAGTISGGSNILINIGAGASPSNGGTITSSTSKPSFYLSHCITMVCFRVKINASILFGDSVSIGGKALYRITAPVSGSLTTGAFPPYKLLIFANTGYCSNGLNVPVNSDSLGTFASGTTTNRPTPLLYTTTYVKQTLGASAPQDYYSAIVQNSSPDSSTNLTSTIASYSVFGFWYIFVCHPCDA